jgi:glycosyltransferase involved in cell wall biosynthesis
VKAPLRILAANWRDLKNPEMGGAEVHLHEILKRLASWGHEITLIASAWPGAAPEERYDGIEVLRAGRWWNANWVIPRWARRLLAERHFDVIVEDVNKIPFFLPLWTKTPHLLVVPHLFGTTVFRETNAILATYVYLFELFIPRVYRKSLVAAISPSTREDLIRRGIDGQRIAVSYCGFDPEPFSLAEKPPRGPEIRLIHLGRLRRYKGADLVLEAFAKIRQQLPAASLDFVGDGPEAPALRNRAESLGLGEAVRFHGHLPQEQMVDLLYRSHLFLNASPKEGWGLTVVEAGACGVPTVAANSPGLRDSVRDGETGLLVPYGDTDAMAAAALSLLQDETRRAEMGERASARARSFSWDRTAEEILALIERLVHVGEGAPP